MWIYIVCKLINLFIALLNKNAEVVSYWLSLSIKGEQWSRVCNIHFKVKGTMHIFSHLSHNIQTLVLVVLDALSIAVLQLKI